MAGTNVLPLSLKTVTPCHGILEEGTLWDVECNKDENNANYANRRIG